MEKNFRITVVGNIQGKSFRSIIMYRAGSLKLKGVVAYLGLTSLYVEVEGEEQTLSEFLSWCRSLIYEDIINKVTIEEGTPKGYTDFSIRRGQESVEPDTPLNYWSDYIAHHFFTGGHKK
jgi:acylphosphatase